MAEEICQNSRLEKGKIFSVLIENVLPDMVVVSLENGPKCFRGALFSSNKENICHGIGVKREKLVEGLKPPKPPDTVVVQPEIPREDSIVYSLLCNRYSYTQDPEAVDSSLVNNHKQTFPRPLINRSLNRMRLRARQVVCSLCKRGIHDKKTSKDISKIKNSKVDEKYTNSFSASLENKIINVDKKGISSNKKIAANDRKVVNNEKSFCESKKSDRKTPSDSKKRKTFSDPDVQRNEGSKTKRQKIVIKSTPAIKISFASPKGVGTVLKIPPRPSTPIPSDSDLSQDNSDPVRDKAHIKPEKTSKRLKSKKSDSKSSVDQSTSKRSKHSKHKSKKKSKWTILKEKSTVDVNNITPLPNMTPTPKSPVGYRFVTRSSPSDTKSPQDKSSLSPEAMNCKVVIEKLDNQKIASQRFLAQDSNSSSLGNDSVKPTETSSDQTENYSTKESKSEQNVESSVTRTNESCIAQEVENKCDYRQYFEDISDSDSNPLTVDLGDDQVPEDINDENTAPKPLKIHIQTRQVAKCELDDGRILRVGDVVWGKIVGFPWWPAQITLLLESLKDFGTVIAQNAHVNWFGSSTMSIMSCTELYPFLDYYKEKFSKKKKGSYRLAIKQANLVAQTSQKPPNEPIVNVQNASRNLADVTSGESQSSLAQSDVQSNVGQYENISDDEEKLYIALDESPVKPHDMKYIESKQRLKVLDNTDRDPLRFVTPPQQTADKRERIENYNQHKVEFDFFGPKSSDIVSNQIDQLRRSSLDVSQGESMCDSQNEAKSQWSEITNSVTDVRPDLTTPLEHDSTKANLKTQTFSNNENIHSMHLDVQKSDFDVQTVPNSDPVLSSTIRDSISSRPFEESAQLVDELFSDKMVLKSDFNDEHIFEAISDLEEGEIIDSSADET